MTTAEAHTIMQLEAKVDGMQATIDRLRRDLAGARAEAAGLRGYNEGLAKIGKENEAEIERLTAALEPFAEVARWAERNGHDLAKDFDMLLRGPGKEIAGHLQVQSRDFIHAKKILGAEQTVRKT